MNNMDLLNKNAIVTGGAQGIGGAVAKKLASNGARLAIWDLDFDLATKKATAVGEWLDCYRSRCFKLAKCTECLC